jgi:hypothetical protein
VAAQQPTAAAEREAWCDGRFLQTVTRVVDNPATGCAGGMLDVHVGSRCRDCPSLVGVVRLTADANTDSLMAAVSPIGS